MTSQPGRAQLGASDVDDLYFGERAVRSPWGLDDDDPGPGHFADKGYTSEAAYKAAYKAEVAEQLRLSRLRLYSYCMTLSACVLALMAFMYLLTGTADGDPEFTSLGVMFVGMMVLMLWAAMRVTRASES